MSWAAGRVSKCGLFDDFLLDLTILNDWWISSPLRGSSQERQSALVHRRCTTFHLQLRQKATLLRSQEKTSPPPKAKAASSLTVSDERSHPGAAGHTSAVSKGRPMRSMREVAVSTRTVSVNRRRDRRDKEWRREIRTVGEELYASPRKSESVTTTCVSSAAQSEMNSLSS